MRGALAGIEVWSLVTDSAERVNSVREVLQFVARPGRFVDHPPERNLREWDRLGAIRRCAGIGGHRCAPDRHPRRRPRAAAADGLPALFPVPAHAPAGRAARCPAGWTRTATRSLARCAAATPTSRWTRSRRRRVRLHRRGTGRAAHGLRVARGAVHAADARAASGRLRLLRDGREIASADRRDGAGRTTSPSRASTG